MGIGDFFKKGTKAVGDKVSGVKQAAQQKLIEQQLKRIPEPQRSMLLKAIQSNPEFFKNLETEIKAEMKQGKNQMAAAMSVMRRHQGDLQKMMMQEAGVKMPQPKGK